MEKTCPYCAEPIRAEAVRCPHCRSRLRGFIAEGWQREQSDALVAGVAAALARAFAVPVALVRVAFVVMALVHGVGLMLYGALWLLIPKRAGEPSVLEDFLRRAQIVAHRVGTGHVCGERHASAPPPSNARTDVSDAPLNGS